MNLTVFAMRRPITTLMLVVALIGGGALAYSRMRVDIFPSLNTPKIYVFLDNVGMSPDQMEGFIVNQLELFFQYVDGIKDIDTKNIQQVSLCEPSFFPGTDMGQAMAQVVAMSDRATSWMPKGTLPPIIMRMDAGSVPVDYLQLTAPYDGVIVSRNANTGDFVLPATGDPTAMQRAPHLSPGGTAAPIYVVNRTDLVRIFVDIPEQDADYAHIGSKATVLARAFRNEELPATVTRTSWALNVQSRTLRAEIDLPNPGGQLLPGMYA
ncbi:Barrel-sandwich domain of CusB or HlyD membrane-fusion [Singulisphaera sp. GP187]|uniref:efflux RND transporter periplasmic adaptor subunit n=1 Tax=Singulisphaera sp. GP187 TaxID=1882752 RepID=UPI000929746C|nr:efflux RND transporter permease subunit [Singulisphaera sp. GP187]SIO32833.1 Barrel-sandwich domain of CusB or HlyD membrane-fusion [Singulisphaera sp. GP187]